MIEIRRAIKVGASYAPTLIIILYFLFIGLDIFSTFLVTPDLTFEANWFIKVLNLRWWQIILLATIIAISFCSLFLYSTGRILINMDEKQNSSKPPTFISKILYYFLIILFISHFFGSIIVTINNFLNYIYLNHPNSFLFPISLSLVNFETKMASAYFIGTQIFNLIIGTSFAIFWIKALKRGN